MILNYEWILQVQEKKNIELGLKNNLTVLVKDRLLVMQMIAINQKNLP